MSEFFGYLQCGIEMWPLLVIYVLLMSITIVAILLCIYFLKGCIKQIIMPRDDPPPSPVSTLPTLPPPTTNQHPVSILKKTYRIPRPVISTTSLQHTV